MKKSIILSKKGITPIIAIILLLMMTIAIAGLAFTFIQRYETGIESSTENTTKRTLQSFKANLKIDGYNTTCGNVSSWVLVRIHIRNAGTEPATNLQLFVDDAPLNGSANESLGAGISTSYLLKNNSCFNWINRTRVLKLVSDEQESQRSFTFRCAANQSC